MKNRLSKIVCLLLLCMAFAIGTDGSGVVVSVQAASQTAAQKAKAQREKEKAKQAKARAKAKAKAAKEREKASQQKAKQSQQSQQAKQTLLSQQVKQTSDEIWEEKVAEIEKYNAKVARYMSRDITHRIGFWGQVGYSDLLPKGFQYHSDDQTGFDVKNKGRAGGGGGIGYQLRYKRLLFTTGAEAQIYTSIYELSSTEFGLIQRTFDVAPYQGEMQYTYRFADCKDQLKAGFVQVPVLFGMEFANKRAYFLAGSKVGLGLIGQSTVSGSLTTDIYDKTTINPYKDMLNHALVRDEGYQTVSSLKWNMNLAVHGEIGVSFDRWLNSQAVALRLAAFAEYGVLNVQTSKNLLGECDQPVEYAKVLAGGHPTRDVAMISALNTTTGQARINPLLVGVKASCWFNLPRQEKRPMAIPKQPMPGLMAKVVDVQSGNALAGALVTISSLGASPVSKTTNTKGMVVTRLPKGEYTLAASKVGYITDSISYALMRDMRDTLFISLRLEPKPVEPTMAGRVYARETKQPLEAEVQVLSLGANRLYDGATADDGLFVTNLRSGQYIVFVRARGYMPMTDTVWASADTLSLFMTKIKEGIKMKIEHLYFATNKTTILPQSEGALADLAQFMLDNMAVRIRLVGHTDNVGSDQANQKLSEGRAYSLRSELIKRGVEGSRIEAEGRGEREPVATNDTEEGRQQNRRVEFTVLSAEQ